MATTTATGGTEFLPALDIDAPAEQRRWSIALRLILLIPHLIVLFFLGIAVFFVVIAGWVAALFLGRLPDGIHRFLAGYLGWWTRVSAYGYLLLDAYPPFAMSAPDYPVRIELRQDPLNRVAVLFRFVLVIPAAIVSQIVAAGWSAASFVIWLAVLISGHAPPALFESTAAVQRYVMRYNAYAMLLTPAYPKRLFGDEGLEEQPRVSPTRPLILSPNGRVLLIVLVVVGVFGLVVQTITQITVQSNM
ncbi:DUF4389 domain-containing protein [Spirillospora sp. NPDC047279]|uniref:DUF4389 domain-containing protein n=1 Tax=Spirillospora sp. NPDC047279 TaxID=3155478 RepID=UPI0033E8FD5B